MAVSACQGFCEASQKVWKRQASRSWSRWSSLGCFSGRLAEPLHFVHHELLEPKSLPCLWIQLSCISTISDGLIFFPFLSSKHARAGTRAARVASGEAPGFSDRELALEFVRRAVAIAIASSAPHRFKLFSTPALFQACCTLKVMGVSPTRRSHEKSNPRTPNKKPKRKTTRQSPQGPPGTRRSRAAAPRA